jgi:hypothetical protein
MWVVKHLCEERSADSEDKAAEGDHVAGGSAGCLSGRAGRGRRGCRWAERGTSRAGNGGVDAGDDGGDQCWNRRDGGHAWGWDNN